MTRAGAGAHSLSIAAVLVALAQSSPASACTPAEASKTYAEARRAFEAKHFDESIVLLRSAYACDPNPIYLGNIARAYEEAGKSSEALAAWRAYLEVTKDPRERSQIEGRISVLSKLNADIERLAREKATAEDAKRTADLAEAERRRRERPPPPPPPRSPVPVGALVVTAVGVAGLGTGVLLAILADGKHGDATDEPSATKADSLQKDGETFAEGANWCFALGGAVTAAGVGWLAVSLLRPTAESPTRAALIGTGSGLAIRGSF